MPQNHNDLPFSFKPSSHMSARVSFTGRTSIEGRKGAYKATGNFQGIYLNKLEVTAASEVLRVETIYYLLLKYL